LNATKSRSSDVAARIRGTERRSTQRRRLLEPVQVRLTRGDPPKGRACPAVMLNATAHGMACRIPASQLELLPSEGGMVQVVFCLEPESAPFELQAEVRSLTEAGTPGYYVMGMEFVFDESTGGKKDRLQAALDAVSAGGGVA